MAYDRTRGQHQAAVLYRMLRSDGRFPTKVVATLAGISADLLEDWVLNRAPVPLWAAARLAEAFDQLAPGAGAAFLAEALQLDGHASIHWSARRGLCPTETTLGLLEAFDRFNSVARRSLVDARTPGRIDHEELLELEPPRRELVLHVTRLGAAVLAVDRQQRRLALEAP